MAPPGSAAVREADVDSRSVHEGFEQQERFPAEQARANDYTSVKSPRAVIHFVPALCFCARLMPAGGWQTILDVAQSISGAEK